MRRTSQTPLLTSGGNESKLVSHARILSLLGSTLVSLSAGSNYAFSSFAPQLQDSAHLTSTQINVVGLAGNVGVYLSSPLWGKWVDRKGPRTALIVGAVLVLIGYWGLSTVYSSEGAVHPSTLAPPRSSFKFPLIVFLNLMTGLGNSGAFTAAMNAQAKSWGGNRRGSATALVLSGFGLSAFFYSSLSHTLFPGNTADYLLLLAWGSAASFLIGLAVVRILPPQELAPHVAGLEDGADYAPLSTTSADEDDTQEGEHARRKSHRPRSSISYSRRRTSSDLSAIVYARSSELAHTDTEESSDEAEGEDQEDYHDEDDARNNIQQDGTAMNTRNKPSAELTGAEAAQHATSADPEALRRMRRKSKRRAKARAGANAANNGDGLAGEHYHADAIDVTGFALLKRVDFILLFLIMAFISGAGLLLINNVGTITRTLWRYNHRNGHGDEGDGWSVRDAVGLMNGGGKDDDAAAVQQLQAHQVSAISIGNALGRILIGLLADFVVNRTGSDKLRVWMLLPVCFLAILSQSLAAAPNRITTLRALLGVSALTGLMYGTLFGICPSLNLEFFGLRNFSQNWGFVSLSPVVAGNLFNLLFGKLYDANVDSDSQGHECKLGEECYRKVFVVTTWCAVAATGLSLILIQRRAGTPDWARRHRP